MGSKALRREASRAYSSRRWKVQAAQPAAVEVQARAIGDEAAHAHVVFGEGAGLSTHSRLAAPRVSTTAVRRTSTRRRARRQAPRARNTVSTMGNSSGSSAMARGDACQRAGQPLPRSRPCSITSKGWRQRGEAEQPHQPRTSRL